VNPKRLALQSLAGGLEKTKLEISILAKLIFSDNFSLTSNARIGKPIDGYITVLLQGLRLQKFLWLLSSERK